MFRNSLFVFFMITASLQGADILQLVNILDRNDNNTFNTYIQTAADANTMRSDNHKSILMYAVWVGNKDAVTLLVEKGADINAQDTGGASALHLAAWKGHKEIALYLISKGASGYLPSKEGMTPLDIALLQGNKEIAELIEKGGNPRKKLF